MHHNGFVECSGKVPIVCETEVLVVGGGPTGIAAAVACARNGAKTMKMSPRVVSSPTRRLTSPMPKRLPARTTRAPLEREPDVHVGLRNQAVMWPWERWSKRAWHMGEIIPRPRAMIVIGPGDSIAEFVPSANFRAMLGAMWKYGASYREPAIE